MSCGEALAERHGGSEDKDTITDSVIHMIQTAVAQLNATLAVEWVNVASRSSLRDDERLSELVRIDDALKSLKKKVDLTAVAGLPADFDAAVTSFYAYIKSIQTTVALSALRKNLSGPDPDIVADLATLAELGERRRQPHMKNTYAVHMRYGDSPEVKIIGPNGSVDLQLHEWTRPKLGWSSLLKPSAVHRFTQWRGDGASSDLTPGDLPEIAAVQDGKFHVFIYEPVLDDENDWDSNPPIGAFEFPVAVLEEYFRALDASWRSP